MKRFFVVTTFERTWNVIHLLEKALNPASQRNQPFIHEQMEECRNKHLL